MSGKGMMDERKHQHHHRRNRQSDSFCCKTDDNASAAAAAAFSSSLYPDISTSDTECWSLSAGATPASSEPQSGDLSFDQLIASPVPFDDHDVRDDDYNDDDVYQEIQSDFLPLDRGDQLEDSDGYLDDGSDMLLLRDRDEAGNAFIPFTLLSTIEEEDENEEMVASEAAKAAAGEADSSVDRGKGEVDRKEDSSGMHESECKRQSRS